MSQDGQREAGAQLMGVLLSLQARSDTYRRAFVAYAAYALGDAHQADEEALHNEALRALQALRDQEGADVEAQLHAALNVFCPAYWIWYRSLAEGVMAEVLQHPALVHLLVENPQLCLADALPLWQQRN